MPAGKQFFGELIEHWKALPRSGGPIPLKTTFSPMRLYKMLPHLYFSERMEKYNVRIRLMGDELEAATRHMVPNRNVFDAIPKSEWDRVENYYDLFCSHPCAGHMIRSLDFDNGLVYDVETLGLPLADADGNPRFVVGLAELTQNRAKSLKARNNGGHVNVVDVLDYWDLGLGIPAVNDDTPQVKQANGV